MTYYVLHVSLYSRYDLTLGYLWYFKKRVPCCYRQLLHKGSNCRRLNFSKGCQLALSNKILKASPSLHPMRDLKSKSVLLKIIQFWLVVTATTKDNQRQSVKYPLQQTLIYAHSVSQRWERDSVFILMYNDGMGEVDLMDKKRYRLVAKQGTQLLGRNNAKSFRHSLCATAITLLILRTQFLDFASGIVFEVLLRSYVCVCGQP